MRELALFAGAGGGLLASTLIGWCTVCAVELDSYCRRQLLARQRDGCLPIFPIWDDVRTFDGRPWRGHIDVISGGFPCQDISAAGQGDGITGARSGLVFEMLRIVNEVRPPFVFAENSPHLRVKGLATIVERFIGMGYVGRVGVLGAGDIGANHNRKRMWIVAISKGVRCRQREARGSSTSIEGLQQQTFQTSCRESSNTQKNAADTNYKLIWKQSRRVWGEKGESKEKLRITDWWDLPRFAGVDDGMANRMDRVKATGNGQVPGVAAFAWKVLTSDIDDFGIKDEL